MDKPDNPYVGRFRSYSTLRKLWNGEVVEVEGVRVKKAEGEIRPGDDYVAERNSGPKLLVAREIDTRVGCIHPAVKGYSFDIWECIKVEGSGLTV